MYWAVDLLASEYGWSKNDILETVYLDEYLLLSELIQKRYLEQKMMDISVVHSQDPQKLYQSLQKSERALSISDRPSYIDAEFNPDQMAAFKATLKRSPRIDVR